MWPREFQAEFNCCKLAKLTGRCCLALNVGPDLWKGACVWLVDQRHATDSSARVNRTADQGKQQISHGAVNAVQKRIARLRVAMVPVYRTCINSEHISGPGKLRNTSAMSGMNDTWRRRLHATLHEGTRDRTFKQVRSQIG